MAEKYVKDILEKLEEIEGLHAKLRSLVPRMRNYEAGSGSNGVHGPSKSEKRSDRVTLEEKQGKKNSWKRKLSDIGVNPGRLKSTRSSKYLKRLRRSSLNFVVGQWRDKKERIKNLLAGLVENDVILVSRAAQTAEDEGPLDATEEAQSATGNERNRLPRKERRSNKKRTSSSQELLRRLLERFNYPRDSELAAHGRVSFHERPLGNREPRTVRKHLLRPDEEAETSAVISNAARVSLDDNETNSSSSGRLRRLVRKRAAGRSED
ncbi:uncharacterized protein LOC116434923 [Nomia melanderi]|uniref:uncharacterized protein LOC116434923 n=1 Tax=Nomia melanderi TaxID=2448451 RepID=UPI003FCE7C98